MLPGSGLAGAHGPNRKPGSDEEPEDHDANAQQSLVHPTGEAAADEPAEQRARRRDRYVEPVHRGEKHERHE